MTLNDYLTDLPLIAILRGIQPDEVIDVGDALVAAGFRVIEIPLNSPEPLDSIERLATHLGEDDASAEVAERLRAVAPVPAWARRPLAAAG